VIVAVAAIAQAVAVGAVGIDRQASGLFLTRASGVQAGAVVITETARALAARQLVVAAADGARVGLAESALDGWPRHDMRIIHTFGREARGRVGGKGKIGHSAESFFREWAGIEARPVDAMPLCGGFSWCLAPVGTEA
jgi:hypothetical protein